MATVTVFRIIVSLREKEREREEDINFASMARSNLQTTDALNLLEKNCRFAFDGSFSQGTILFFFFKVVNATLDFYFTYPIVRWMPKHRTNLRFYFFSWTKRLETNWFSSSWTKWMQIFNKRQRKFCANFLFVYVENGLQIQICSGIYIFYHLFSESRLSVAGGSDMCVCVWVREARNK